MKDSDELRTAIAIWQAGHLDDGDAALEVAHNAFGTKEPQLTASLAAGALARLAGVLAARLAYIAGGVTDHEAGAAEVMRQVAEQLDLEDAEDEGRAG